MSGGVEDSVKYWENKQKKFNDEEKNIFTEEYRIKFIQNALQNNYIAAQYIYFLEKRIEKLEIKLGER